MGLYVCTHMSMHACSFLCMTHAQWLCKGFFGVSCYQADMRIYASLTIRQIQVGGRQAWQHVECAVLCPACAQVIIMQTPVGTFFKVHPINGIEWAISVAIGISAIPVSILTRLLTRACKCLPSPTDLRGHRGRRGRRTGEQV